MTIVKSRKPAVSIIIPAYNAARTLSRALASVQAQTMPDWEIVLVNDGSVDDTSIVANDWREKLGNRLRYYEQSNQGPSAARNLGINLASGEFISFLDADDAYHPMALQRCLSCFHRCPSLGFVFYDYECMALDGRTIASALRKFFPIVYLLPRSSIGDNTYVFSSGIAQWLGEHYFVSTISAMIRRTVLSNDVRFCTRISYSEEQLFFQEVAQCCRSGFLDEALALHYFTEGSLTRSSKESNLRRRIAFQREMMALAIHTGTHSQRCTAKQNLRDAQLADACHKRRANGSMKFSVFADGLKSSLMESGSRIVSLSGPMDREEEIRPC